MGVPQREPRWPTRMCDVDDDACGPDALWHVNINIADCHYMVCHALSQTYCTAMTLCASFSAQDIYLEHSGRWQRLAAAASK